MPSSMEILARSSVGALAWIGRLMRSDPTGVGKMGAGLAIRHRKCQQSGWAMRSGLACDISRGGLGMSWPEWAPR